MNTNIGILPINRAHPPGAGPAPTAATRTLLRTEVRAPIAWRQLNRWLAAGAALSLLLCAGLARAATYLVTTTADSGPGSLRQAILDANASPGADTINFNITGPADFVNGGQYGYTINSVPPPGPAGVFLYAIDNFGTQIQKFDFAGNPIGSPVTVTFAGHTIERETGLATNPVDDQMYAILQTEAGASHRRLVKIDPVTGVATDVGDTGLAVADIAFTLDGTLYAVTGQQAGSGQAESLYTLSLVNGAKTLIGRLGRGNDGEGLAVNYAENLPYGQLYHMSGKRPDRIFEKINDNGAFPVAGVCPTTDIPLPDKNPNEPMAMVGIGTGGFVWKVFSTGGLRNVRTDGVESLVPSSISFQAGGLAFSPAFTGNYSYPFSLPTITDTVTIDGATQPGASASRHLIEIKGSSIILTGTASSGSVIRGLVINNAPGDGGIFAFINSHNHVIENNFVGTDPTGTLANPNSGLGVYLESGYGHTVKDNLLSGNRFWGLFLNEHTSPSGFNNVQNNKIGTDISGALPIPNGAGIGSWTGNNLVRDNIIAFNTVNGIEMRGSGGSWQNNSTFLNNIVSSNGRNGILLTSSGNLVGGGNLIAFNARDGVSVGSTVVNNAILGNSIYSNGLLGIDLGLDGVTLNDTTSAIVLSGTDITSPGDVIVGSSASSPAAEQPANAIDGNSNTKYLNFDKEGSGFTVSPSGSGIVTSMSLTSANDAPARDPKVVELAGSNAGAQPSFNDASWVPIATISDIAFSARFETKVFQFANSTAYKHYRWKALEIANSSTANSMQIAEVELLKNLTTAFSQDPDGGANHRQNFPVLDAAQSVINPALVIAAGSLSSEPNTDYLVQVFSDDAGSAVCFHVPVAAAGPNLALASSGAVASQSTTAYGGVASRGNDGNTDGNYGDGSVTHTMGDSDSAIQNSYWQVQLPTSQTISAVFLHNRSDCCGGRLSNFKVTVYNGATDVAHQDFYVGSGSVPQGGVEQWVLASSVTGDRVRIELLGHNNEGNGVLSLAEVEVFGGVTHNISMSCGVDEFLTAEGRHFLGSIPVRTDAHGYAAFRTILKDAVPAGQFMTATATKMAGGVPVETSEFSEAIDVAVGSSKAYPHALGAAGGNKP